MSYQINENGDHSSEKLDGSCQCHCIIQCAIASIRPDREKKKVKTGQHFVTKPTTHSSGCRDCKDQTKQEKCAPVLRTGLNVTETYLLYYYYYYFIKLVLICLFSYHYFIFYYIGFSYYFKPSPFVKPFLIYLLSFLAKHTFGALFLGTVANDSFVNFHRGTKTTIPYTPWC